MNYERATHEFTKWFKGNGYKIVARKEADYNKIFAALNIKRIWRMFFFHPKTIYYEWMGPNYLIISGIAPLDFINEELNHRMFSESYTFEQYMKLKCCVRVKTKNCHYGKNVLLPITYESLLKFWKTHYKKVFRNKSKWKRRIPLSILKSLDNIIRENISLHLRTKVLKRDNYTCQYCGATNVKLHVDHIKPVCQGGTNNIRNLVTACEKCNCKKSGRTPKQAGMELMKCQTG